MATRDTRSGLRDQALSALALLTRLPLPDHHPQGAASAWAWPLAGLVIGGLAAAALALCDAIGLPPGPSAAAALAVQALVTGALHEDGLADTADGLIGGRDRDRRLEIMKDSRIGSFGALALLLVVLAQWSALAAAQHAALALIAAAALSRAPMAVLMATLPPARTSGLSVSLGRPSRVTAAVAAGLGLVLALVLTGTAALAAALLATVLCTLLALTARARIGGQTGDILGAAQQLSFAAALAVLA